MASLIACAEMPRHSPGQLVRKLPNSSTKKASRASNGRLRNHGSSHVLGSIIHMHYLH